MSLVRFFFFFSSRRRHTRFDCDWSSDVCSSDLINNVRRTYGSEARNDQHERAKNQGESFHSQILRSEEHTSELQSQSNLVCRLLLEKKKKKKKYLYKQLTNENMNR